MRNQDRRDEAAVDPQTALDDWTHSPLGEHLIGLEQTLVDGVLPRLYGFHLMQLGLSTRTPMYASSMIRHRFMLAASAPAGGVSALSEPEQLPIEGDSVDVVLLHHALEYSSNPYQLLREAARVVVPHGHLIVFGFNPLSAFGVRALASRRFGSPVWQGQLYSARRVADWLRLLDFGIDSVQYAGHSLPVQNPRLLQRLGGDGPTGNALGASGGRVLDDSRLQAGQYAHASAPVPALAHTPAQRAAASGQCPSSHIALMGIAPVMKQVVMYTDGACKGNPGPGGWGVLLRYGDTEKELCGGESQTTNNRMELQAAIEGLQTLRTPCEVELHTDSEYLRKGITEWIHNWKKRGWKTADRKPVKNADLWKALESAAAPHSVTWNWVKGHSGHPGNERADALANRGIEQLNRC